MKRYIFAITLLTFTSACALPKKVNPLPESQVSVTLTPQELADAFEYRDNKISKQLEEMRLEFVGRINSLQTQISEQAKKDTPMKKTAKEVTKKTLERTIDAQFNQTMKKGRTNPKPAINTGSPFKKK